MAAQTVCHPICERPVPPQANTCTDLMTVFCSGHVAAGEMYMYVCVIKSKMNVVVKFLCLAQSGGNTTVC